MLIAFCFGLIFFRKGTWFDVPKYIVQQNKLMELMRRCMECGAPAVACKSDEQGAYVQYKITCQSTKCRHIGLWSSSDKVRQKFVINLLLSAAILFTGGLASKFLRAMAAINVLAPSQRTFFRHQTDYLHGVNIPHFYSTSIVRLMEIQGPSIVYSFSSSVQHQNQLF